MRQFSTAMHVIVLVITAAATVITALVEFGIITDKPWWAVTVVIVAVVAVMLSGFRSLAWERTEVETLQIKRQIQKAIIPVLTAAAETSGVKITQIGVSVFETKRNRFRKWKMHLSRVLRFRLSDHPQESRVRWVPAKGAIGRAWKEGNIVHIDWMEVRRRVPVADEAYFAQPSEVLDVDLQGFSYPEYRNIESKYAEILAIPIIKESSNARCIGVLAIDIPQGVLPQKPGRLDDLDLVSLGTTAASTIANVLGKR
ncbi:hypothetical protein [Lysinibacter cavernae]|uniref:GAF domain-containing protein n=1 Tax=Lysinibacter cavernae TaxID=1640652 RepID=A0A7X5QZ20_9MICO|nr:hypothetical protein [Lysinibacter cavernae]NIH52564.1 hypothetical protein [Lysinibacter cavernae]